jgi:hypothetical protein
MLNELFLGLARSNALVDLALDVQEKLSREARAAAYAIGVLGFGAGLTVASALTCTTVAVTPFELAGVGVGVAVGVGGGVRLYVARQRLARLKDFVTAKAARDAAAKAAAAGADLVSQGVAAASSAARTTLEGVGRIFTRDKRK